MGGWEVMGWERKEERDERGGEVRGGGGEQL